MKMLARAALLLSICLSPAAIAQKTSSFPAASTLTGSELVPVIQGGANRNASPAQIGNYTLGTDLGVRRLGREVLVNLLANASTTITAIGDSTSAVVMSAGQLPTVKSWTYRNAAAIAAEYPNARVEFFQWNNTTQRYMAPYVVQAGALGERYLSSSIPATASTFRTRTLQAASTPNPSGDNLELETKFQVATSGVPSSAEMTITAHSGGGVTRQYQLTLGADLSLNFDFVTAQTPTGAWIRSTATAAQAAITPGVDVSFKTTLLMQNGQGGYTVTFYRSADNGATWSQIAQTVNTTAGAALNLNKAVDANGYNSVKYEVGAVTDSVTPFVGRIYRVLLRDGIDGPLITPYTIESWVSASTAPSSTTLGGSPTLYWFNGSYAGQGLAYFSDTTRFPKLVGPQRNGLVMLSDAKNEGAAHGTIFTGLLDTWDAQVKARTGAPIAYVAQNPSLPAIMGAPADLTNLRMTQAISWAQAKGYAVIDPRPAFYAYPNGIEAVTKADGNHPTDENTQVSGSVQGYALWADVVRRFFGLANAVAN